MHRCEAGGISEQNAISLNAGGKRVERGPSWLSLLGKGGCSISQMRQHSIVGSQWAVPSFFTVSEKGEVQPFYVEKRTINNETTAESK